MRTENTYKEALEEILRMATTPDTNVVAALPGGRAGPIWSEGGKQQAYEEIVRIAREAPGPDLRRCHSPSSHS